MSEIISLIFSCDCMYIFVVLSTSLIFDVELSAETLFSYEKVERL